MACRMRQTVSGLPRNEDIVRLQTYQESLHSLNRYFIFTENIIFNIPSSHNDSTLSSLVIVIILSFFFTSFSQHKIILGSTSKGAEQT